MGSSSMSSLDLIWNSLPITDQVRVLRHELMDTNRRVGEMERKFRKIRPNLCLEVLGVLREIGSLKEWIVALMYLTVLILFLTGKITLADLKSTFLSTHAGD